jgi:hypothetical protein
MNKWTGIALAAVGVIIGILLVTLLVPPMYAVFAQANGNWTGNFCHATALAGACTDPVVSANCRTCPTDNTSVTMPFGAIISTVVPLILGILVLVAIALGIFGLLKSNKKF